jgi:hypothetical protein
MPLQEGHQFADLARLPLATQIIIVGPQVEAEGAQFFGVKMVHQDIA